MKAGHTSQGKISGKLVYPSPWNFPNWLKHLHHTDIVVFVVVVVFFFSQTILLKLLHIKYILLTVAVCSFVSVCLCGGASSFTRSATSVLGPSIGLHVFSQSAPEHQDVPVDGEHGSNHSAGHTPPPQGPHRVGLEEVM